MKWSKPYRNQAYIGEIAKFGYKRSYPNAILPFSMSEYKYSEKGVWGKRGKTQLKQHLYQQHISALCCDHILKHINPGISDLSISQA